MFFNYFFFKDISAVSRSAVNKVVAMNPGYWTSHGFNSLLLQTMQGFVKQESSGKDFLFYFWKDLHANKVDQPSHFVIERADGVYVL